VTSGARARGRAPERAEDRKQDQAQDREREGPGAAAPVSISSLLLLLREQLVSSPRTDHSGRTSRERPILVDLRSLAAYRGGHLAGAVCLPAARLHRSLFLLPPPERPLLLVAARPAKAEEAAAFLAGRRLGPVRWLDGRASAVPASLLRAGTEPNRAWEPSPWVRENLPLLPPRARACDLACGSGRNAVFLALHGHTVQGVDVLPDALRQARVLAHAAAAPAGRARFRRGDLEDPKTARRILRPRSLDAILCFRYLERPLWPLMLEALAPKGVLLCETFLEAQARAGRRPRHPAFLLRPGELREAFRGLEILRYREGPDAAGDHLASLAARRRG
jgi:tellurite methyltransferase